MKKNELEKEVNDYIINNIHFKEINKLSRRINRMFKMDKIFYKDEI